MHTIPYEHIDLDLIENPNDTLFVLKPYQGAQKFHGDKLESDVKAAVVLKDER